MEAKTKQNKTKQNELIRKKQERILFPKAEVETKRNQKKKKPSPTTAVLKGRIICASNLSLGNSELSSILSVYRAAEKVK
jgi:hypothetical protein